MNPLGNRLHNFAATGLNRLEVLKALNAKRADERADKLYVDIMT